MVISFLAVVLLGVIAWFGAGAQESEGLRYAFGVVIPLAAVAIFLAGFIWRIVNWASSPVPFRIPTTGGQQRSLDWIKPAPLDSPYTVGGTIGRMLLEVLLFRSLFRNSSSELKSGPRLVYWSSKWLWFFSLTFHYCFLVVFLRHFRFFLDPVPGAIAALEWVDGIMQVGVPRFYMTDLLIVVGLLFLLGRRLVDKKLRYISLPSDFFPLFLLLGVVCTGIFMRYFTKTDIASVKVFTMSLATLHPALPDASFSISPLFFVHLFLVSVLLMYFPFSKLMHAGGVFLSPTRNLPNNSRAVHHNNPWNPPKEYRTYAEYENDFRDLMDEAGLPLEITPEEAAASAGTKE